MTGVQTCALPISASINPICLTNLLKSASSLCSLLITGMNASCLFLIVSADDQKRQNVAFMTVGLSMTSLFVCVPDDRLVVSGYYRSVAGNIQRLCVDAADAFPVRLLSSFPRGKERKVANTSRADGGLRNSSSRGTCSRSSAQVTIRR